MTIPAPSRVTTARPILKPIRKISNLRVLSGRCSSGMNTPIRLFSDALANAARALFSSEKIDLSLLRVAVTWRVTTWLMPGNFSYPNPVIVVRVLRISYAYPISYTVTLTLWQIPAEWYRNAHSNIPQHFFSFHVAGYKKFFVPIWFDVAINWTDVASPGKLLWYLV